MFTQKFNSPTADIDKRGKFLCVILELIADHSPGNHKPDARSIFGFVIFHEGYPFLVEL
jgi:hypothetical protein